MSGVLLALLMFANINLHLGGSPPLVIPSCHMEGYTKNQFLASDMTVTDNGSNFTVSGTAVLWGKTKDTVQATVMKNIPWHPDLAVAGGMATVTDGGKRVSYTTTFSRSKLGKPGSVVTLFIHFAVPMQVDRNTCRVTFTL